LRRTIETLRQTVSSRYWNLFIWIIHHQNNPDLCAGHAGIQRWDIKHYSHHHMIQYVSAFLSSDAFVFELIQHSKVLSKRTKSSCIQLAGPLKQRPIYATLSALLD